MENENEIENVESDVLVAVNVWKLQKLMLWKIQIF